MTTLETHASFGTFWYPRLTQFASADNSGCREDMLPIPLPRHPGSKHRAAPGPCGQCPRVWKGQTAGRKKYGPLIFWHAFSFLFFSFWAKKCGPRHGRAFKISLQRQGWSSEKPSNALSHPTAASAQAMNKMPRADTLSVMSSERWSSTLNQGSIEPIPESRRLLFLQWG